MMKSLTVLNVKFTIPGLHPPLCLIEYIEVLFYAHSNIRMNPWALSYFGIYSEVHFSTERSVH